MAETMLVTGAGKVAVVIVNWEGWQDTVLCLESLDELTVRPTQVVLVDNGSSDASADHLDDWLRNHGERSGTTYELLRLPGNFGFAAANNAGIRHVESSGQHIDYYWILNNDTRPDKNALGGLLERASRRDSAGMYGSVVLDDQEPHAVQALAGGQYRACTAQARHVGEGRACTEVWNPADIERQLSYIYGASMLVSHEFLAQVGLMCEDYFLYNEELDWALRGKARGFTLGFAGSSIVYHKGGASFARASGKRDNHRVRDYISIYYLTRGALVATWRWYPWALPCVLATRWGKSLERLLRGQRLAARATALALLAPWRLLLPGDLTALARRS
jgi:hypothetical protein